MRRHSLYGQPPAHERLGEELVIIEAAGLAPYFLVVHNLARYACNRGLPMAVRGRRATRWCATSWGSRTWTRSASAWPSTTPAHGPAGPAGHRPRLRLAGARDEVIAHAFRRYGDAAPGDGQLPPVPPAAALRLPEAGKIHGLSNEQITELAGEVGEEEDGPAQGEEARADAPLPPGFPLEPSSWPRLLPDARRLLGRRGTCRCIRRDRHHAAADGRAGDAPVQWAPKGVVITQMEKDGVEDSRPGEDRPARQPGLSTVDETLQPARAGTPPGSP